MIIPRETIERLRAHQHAVAPGGRIEIRWYEYSYTPCMGVRILNTDDGLVDWIEL